MRVALRRSLCGLLFSCLLSVTWSAAADDKLVLGVHPYLPAAEIKDRFRDFAALLSRAIGRRVEVRVGGDYANHIETIGSDQIDLAFLGPISYIEVTRLYGNKPVLARFEVNHAPYLYGVIFTRRDSGIEGLAELQDRTFAFGDPESTMSHIVPRYMLQQAGIAKGAPPQHKFLGTHRNVALAVLAGDFAAGAVKKEVFDEFAAQGLRALATSPGVPDHIFVARSNLPDELCKKLSATMVAMHTTAEGMAALHKLHKGLTALVPAKDAEYDDLRRIYMAVQSATP